MGRAWEEIRASAFGLVVRFKLERRESRAEQELWTLSRLDEYPVGETSPFARHSFDLPICVKYCASIQCWFSAVLGPRTVARRPPVEIDHILPPLLPRRPPIPYLQSPLSPNVQPTPHPLSHPRCDPARPISRNDFGEDAVARSKGRPERDTETDLGRRVVAQVAARYANES